MSGCARVLRRVCVCGALVCSSAGKFGWDSGTGLTLDACRPTPSSTRCNAPKPAVAPVGDSEGLARALQQLQLLAATDASRDSSATSSPPMFASGEKQAAMPGPVDPRFADGAATELPPSANTCPREPQAADARAAASSSPSPRDATNPTALSGSASDVLEERYERGEAAGPTSPSERASVPLAPAVYLKACLLQVGFGG